MAQAARLSRVLYQDEHLFEREWFLGEVVGPELGGAHGGFDGSMAGDHDDFGRIVEHADFFENFKTVDSGEPDIEQNYVEAGLTKQIKTVFPARADAGLVAFVLENALEGFADRGFVVDDEDMRHCLVLGSQFQVLRGFPES